MKLKQSAEDFRVEEITSVIPGDVGAHSLYRLDKRGWNTVDAMEVVRSRWRIDFRRLSFGGLKDRHADTSQYFSIHGGPPRTLTHDALRVTYLGRVETAFTSADIAANRFRLILRELSSAEATAIEKRVAEVQTAGLPNYFDDQRFGSYVGGEFVARLFVLGEYEAGLKLALTGPYEFDKSADKHEKAVLLKYWGQWAECGQHLQRGHTADLVEYLRHRPTDFRGAVARLRPELQGLYLAAYQSFIWNRMLAAWLARVPADRLVELPSKVGRFPAPTSLSADESSDLDALTLPLPSSRMKEALALWQPLVDTALADQGFTLPAMKLPGLRQPFFSKGDRPAWLRPAGLRCETVDDHAVALHFDLPRGSYATIVVKRVTGGFPVEAP